MKWCLPRYRTGVSPRLRGLCALKLACPRSAHLKWCVSDAEAVCPRCVLLCVIGYQFTYQGQHSLSLLSRCRLLRFVNVGSRAPLQQWLEILKPGQCNGRTTDFRQSTSLVCLPSLT